MSNNSIQEFILARKEDFTLAADVASAWAETRQLVVSRFLGHLDARLKQRLKGWKSEPEGALLGASWSGYSIWDPGWREEYGIGLAWEEYGKRTVSGVWRDPDKIGPRGHCEELVTAFAERSLTIRQNDWWEAKVYMKRSDDDWSTPEVLWQMYADKGFLKKIADQLLDMAKISQPILDRWVRSHRHGRRREMA
jgi:hypothetical protein